MKNNPHKRPLIGLLLFLMWSCTAKQERQMSTAVEENLTEQVLGDSLVTNKEVLLYEDGSVQMEGELTYGKRNGLWQSFYPDGSSWSEAHYQSGQLHGDYHVWFQNGQLRIDGQYQEGAKSGLWKFYDEQGQELLEKQYPQ